MNRAQQRQLDARDSTGSDIAILRAQFSELRRFVARLCELQQIEAPPAIIGVDLLTPKDAVFHTGLSRSGVQKRMKSGRYRVVSIGSKKFIDANSL